MPNSGKKLVALALADMANDEGACWPSLRSLATRCNMQQDAISNHVASLQAVGILTVQPRFQGNRQTSNLYSLAPLSELTGSLKQLPWGEVGEKHPPVQIEGGSKSPTGRGVKNTGGEGGEKHPPENLSEGTINGTVIPERDWCPTAETITVAKWFGRKGVTPWSLKEQRAWKAIPPETITEGIECLAAAYSLPNSDGHRVRKELYTLLNNWQGEIDRWRSFKPATKSDVKPAQADYSDPGFLTNDDANHKPKK